MSKMTSFILLSTGCKINVWRNLQTAGTRLWILWISGSPIYSFESCFPCACCAVWNYKWGLLVWRFCSAIKLITGPWATDKLEAVPVIGALYNFYGEDTSIKLFYDLYTSIHVERSWRCSSCWWHRIVWWQFGLPFNFVICWPLQMKILSWRITLSLR